MNNYNKNHNVNNNYNNGGIGFCSLLTIVFIVLKLTDQIDWSWLWVLSPMWIPTVVIVASICIIFGVAFILDMINKVIG